MKKLLILLFLATSLFANIGTIMVTKGDAVVKRADSSTRDAKAGMIVLQGDAIVTQKRSRVQVMLKDETVVTIGSKSNFSFDEYSFDGAESKVAMSSVKGFFRSVTGKIGKLAPDRFKVKTATATIGIRGTDFWGTTGGDTEKFTCNKGAIVVSFAGGEIEVGAGRYLIVSPQGVKEGDASDDDADEASGDDDANDEEDEEEEEEEESKEEDTSNDEKQSSDDGGAKEPVSTEESPLVEVIETEVIEVNIPTEDIADVTQPVEVPEAFTIDITGEDREVEY